jgi:putative ABC transport system permease protein
MSLLAIRNLFHDKVRLAVTLTGIVFAIVLIVVQLGLFLGFVRTISGVIDNSGADIWICARGVPFLEHGAALSERKLYQALATPGVATGKKYIIEQVNWKRPDGSILPALMIGFDPKAGFGGPWGFYTERVADLRTTETVWIDRLYQRKLGIGEIGQTIEINNRRARIIGFTSGIRSFTTSPYIFTSLTNAAAYTNLSEREATYLLVRTAPGANLQAVKAELIRRLRTVDVYTRDEFARKNQAYWLFATGAGFTILLAALLGLVVGVVVVSQTIYASTMDHIREYGTLKAIGASNWYLCAVIVKQATLSAVCGYALGIVVSYAVAYAGRTAEAAVVVPWQMAVAMFGLTLVMCILASFVSIRKVTTIDPAMVFK